MLALYQLTTLLDLVPRMTLTEPQPLRATAHLLTELRATNSVKLRKGHLCPVPSNQWAQYE